MRSGLDHHFQAQQSPEAAEATEADAGARPRAAGTTQTAEWLAKQPEVPWAFEWEALSATSNKCIATSNKCLTSSNKKLLGAISY